jgi:hypothetical protein
MQYTQHPKYIYISQVPFRIMASFCAQCGKEIAEGTRYCPVCGFDTQSQGAGGYNNSNYNPNAGYQQTNVKQGSSGTLKTIAALGIVWALISLLIGIYFFILSTEYYWVYYLGFRMTDTILIILGLVCVIEALLVFVSCIYIFKLQKYSLASTLCLITAILALFLGGIIIGVLGIVFWTLLTKEKQRFTS